MGHTRAWRTAVAAAAAAVAVAAITVPSVAAETAAAPVAPAAAAAPAAPAAAAVTVAAPCNSPLVAGTLPVTIDGVTTQWTVVAAGAAKGVAIAGGAMTMQHDYRGYLVDLSAGDGCPQAWDPSLYDRRLQLLGKQLNYTVDLSTSGCGCNAALYLVGMPGHNSSQQPAPGQGGDFYCDANDVGGVWCPEVDIAEANNMAYQATPHRCAAPTGLWYPSCDKSGCGRNTYRHCGPSCYGPGGAYTIDTTKPFVVSTSFVTDASGTLTNMTTVLAQGSARCVRCGSSNDEWVHSCRVRVLRLHSHLSFACSSLVPVPRAALSWRTTMASAGRTT